MKQLPLLRLLLACLTLLAGMLPSARAAGTTAARATDFLNSLGANSAIAGRGEDIQHTIACTKYLGLRWFRCDSAGNSPLQPYLDLHAATGARMSWGLGSGGSNIPLLISSGEKLAAAGALLDFEGPNEPNNWGITYQGIAGGKDLSWVPVAKLQRDMYAAVKSDPMLKHYPVWSISENGAETDNVGLQFLTIPPGAATVMPPGTKYADYANVHNYFYHPNSPGVEDNKTWNAADPGPGCKVDGLYGEYGLTWGHHYPGYTTAQLQTLPRVTTETGANINGAITEDIQALNILSMYLDQFKRGWSYTALYLLRDRVDEAGNQTFGFYRPDYTPRKSAVYLHNLTTILADTGALAHPGALNYAIPAEPPTVHDMLLEKSDGTFDLIVWDERVTGSNAVPVHLGGTYADVKLYDPTISSGPTVIQGKTSALTLTLTDYPVVIALAPGTDRG